MSRIIIIILILISGPSFSYDRFNSYLNIKLNKFHFGRYTSYFCNNFKNAVSNIGMGFDILESYNFNNKLSIQSGLEFNATDLNLIIPTWINNIYYGPNTHNLTFKEVQFPFYIKYNVINHENFIVYFKTGILYRKIISGKGTLATTPEISSDYISFFITKNRFCPVINIGLEKKIKNRLFFVPEFKYKIINGSYVYNGDGHKMYENIWTVDEQVNLNGIFEISFGVRF